MMGQAVHPGLGVGIGHVVVEDVSRILGTEIVTLCVHQSYVQITFARRRLHQP